MAGDPGQGRPRRITDRDLARLLTRGTRELADDPSATEVYERIRQRQNLEEDRDHRARSDSSALLGGVVGLVLLVGVVVAVIVDFRT